MWLLHRVGVVLSVWLSLVATTYAQTSDATSARSLAPAPALPNPVLTKISEGFRTSSHIIALDPNNAALAAYSMVCDALSMSLVPVPEAGFDVFVFGQFKTAHGGLCIRDRGRCCQRSDKRPYQNEFTHCLLL